jgi:hypothetical protein
LTKEPIGWSGRQNDCLSIALRHHGPVNGPAAEIAVVNGYEWVLNPRQGAFSVYVDGTLVGIAPLSGSLVWPLPAGRHEIRIRLWRYYRSPSRLVDLPAGGRVTMRADKSAGSALRAMALLMFRPFNSLSLEVVENVLAVGTPILGTPDLTRPRRQRVLLVYAVVSTLICAAALIALRLTH